MLSIGLVTLAVVLLLIPSVPGWEGDPERDSLVYVSIPISIALLIVYVGATWISLRRHRQMHVSDEATDMAGWSFRTALIVLGIATVVTALIAEIVVGSIESFADKVGLTEFFVAAVIVAIVGNAAEHGGAVVVAARGQIKLAAEIALASSAQVAVFLIPAVTLLALLIDPLALSFRPVEIAALAFGVVLTFTLLVQGQSSRARGVVLIAGYVAVAVAFFFAGDR
jgi:Ca2+:H+ antiporter